MSTSNVYGTSGRRRATTNEQVVVLAGIQGPAGASFGFEWKGEWDPSAQYKVDDAVRYGGLPYIATADSLNDAPPGSSWELIVSPPTAENVPYDPTDSSLASTDVDAALDELDGKIVDHLASDGGASDHPLFKRRHGFSRGPGSEPLAVLSYDATNRTVFITPSASTFTFWIDGTRFVKTLGETIQHPATTGKHFIYYDDTGTLRTSTTQWSIVDRTVTPVALVYYSVADSKGILFNELHGDERNLDLHKNLHLTQGTKLISGGNISGYTLNTDTDAAVRFGIAAGAVADEDLVTNLSSQADPPAGGYTILYRSGASGEWRISEGNGYPFGFGGTYPQYNNPAGPWTLVELNGGGLGKWVNYYLVAVPAVDAKYQYILIPGQAVYGSLAAASGETLASLSLGDLPFEEVAPIYKITYHALQTYGNTANVEIVAVTAILTGGAQVINSTSSPAVHNSLSGRSATDAHPASAITNTPAGNISATDVQAALNELDTEKSAVGHGHAATEITNTPAGSISAATVQAALNELDTEKLALAGGTMTGQLIVPDGTAAAPGIRLTSEANGFFRGASGTSIGVAIGGVAAARLGNTLTFETVSGALVLYDTTLGRTANGSLYFGATVESMISARRSYTDANNYETFRFGWSGGIGYMGGYNVSAGAVANGSRVILHGAGNTQGLELRPRADLTTGSWSFKTAGLFPLIDAESVIGDTSLRPKQIVVGGANATTPILIKLGATPTAAAINVTNSSDASLLKIDTVGRPTGTGMSGIIRAGCNIPSPAASKNWNVYVAPFAMTVSAIKVIRTGGTSIAVNVGKNGTSTKLLSSDASPGTTWGTASGLQNATLAAGDYLLVMIGAVSGTVDEVAVQIEGYPS
jgi:hypothetical protein